MLIEEYIQVIEDLGRDMPDEQRYQQLLNSIQQSIPSDAIVILRLQGKSLEPIALRGLPLQTLGRRFPIQQHPRLERILNSRTPVRFESDSIIPDPYDGLIDTPDKLLHVHDCMGFSIYIEDKPWGLITLDALRPGQFDDVDADQQRLVFALTRAVVMAAQKLSVLQSEVERGHSYNRTQGTRQLIGNSEAMSQLTDTIHSVAATPLTVLLQGETGTGKEIVARYLHAQSDRCDQPFVQVNCAALPDTLAEAELFGHTKGAFTGANQSRQGRFELADGGTLFLDEVGELPLSLQAKLLRVLQEGDIQRVGSDHTITVNTRVVAATNRNLKQEVEHGEFRADLYHRLSVFPIGLPPLRERDKDVLLLAEFFLERDQHRLNIEKLTLDGPAKHTLLNYSWPGNVRELEHLISRAALKANANQAPSPIVRIGINHLQISNNSETGAATTHSPASSASDTPQSLKQATDQFQSQLIANTLNHHRGNLAATARELQLDRSNLLRLCKRLGLK